MGPGRRGLATITIVVGNVGALGQSSLKRMLAYSSVAQAGYMLAGIVVATGSGQATVLYSPLPDDEHRRVRGDRRARARNGDGRLDRRARGLGRERPWLAWPMTISMLALAGIPATVGFIGKFYLIDARRGRLHVARRRDRDRLDDLAGLLPACDRGDVDARGAQREKLASPGARRRARPRGHSLPAVAGGSPELHEPEPAADRAGRRQPEVLFVAVVAGAATLFFGIVPQPLFELVHHAGQRPSGWACSLRPDERPRRPIQSACCSTSTAFCTSATSRSPGHAGRST